MELLEGLQLPVEEGEEEGADHAEDPDEVVEARAEEPGSSRVRVRVRVKFRAGVRARARARARVRSAWCAPLVQRVGELRVQRVVEAEQRRGQAEDDVEDAGHLGG